MSKIYCLGEAMSDTFITLENAEITGGEKKMLCLPYGEKINVTTFAHKSGGSGFNAACGLKRLGLDPHLIANIGNDSEGKRLKSEMDKEGINSASVVASDEFETKAAIILLGEDGDRTILVYHGKGVLSIGMINWDSIENGAWFYLGPMPETARELIDKVLEFVEKKKLKLVVNPGSVQVEWKKNDNLKIIEKSELYVLNKDEAKSIMGEIDDDKKLLDCFIQAGAKKVIITDGMNGSISSDGENYHHLDIVKVKTRDMTGAGDAYLSGVVAALASNEDLSEAMVWGAINGAAVVQKLGAQEGLLTTEEIKKQKEEIGIKTEAL